MVLNEVIYLFIFIFIICFSCEKSIKLFQISDQNQRRHLVHAKTKCVLCRLEQVTQYVIHWADAICRGTTIYKVPVALEGETNVRFFPAIFFRPSCRLFSLLPCPERTVSVFTAVTPGRPRGGLRADQSRAPICPGLSSCLSCALMALAAMLGEVARFMLVKRGSVRLKGHVSGCRFVFHRDVQEEVSAQDKKNERQIVLVCLSLSLRWLNRDR